MSAKERSPSAPAMPVDRNAGHRMCPQCRKTDQPSVTLSERMTMVQACPFCAHEYQDTEIGREDPPPPPHVAPILLIGTKPRAAAAPAVARPGDLVEAIRDRLTECELLLAGHEGLKAEAKQLRKMLAAADRAPRAQKVIP